MRIGRNDHCWCGSGRKYKACHMAFDQKIRSYEVQGHEVPEPEMIKTPAQIEGMRKAGILNTAVLDYVSEHVREGMTTQEIDDLVREYTVAHGGICAPYGYEGYPKSVCTSINNVVCHGIPSKDRVLKSGDIVNIDVTTILDGYYADASRMFLIGNVSEEARRLVEVTKECLELAVKEVKPWGFLGDIGAVIDEHARKNGYSVVIDIGGHGTGIQFHEEPYVCHVGERGTDMLLVPGMTFTIEPMINEGGYEVYIDEEDGWTVYTEDGSLSAQWEYTLAVTEEGVEILTY
ncbi:MAG: methionyl aminopeptidase [Lachnospiraceae bacterium]|nr:methionyl aminopeptidase [Lachnospiraceae bacterium]